MAQDTAEQTLAELVTIQMLLDLAVQRVENLSDPKVGRFWERDLHTLISEIEDARREL